MTEKIIVLAGSGAGFGEALQQRFKEGGYHVVAASRQGAGHQHVDLSDPVATQNFFTELDQQGQLAGVIHNAMQFHRQPFLESDADTFQAVWRSMVLTAFNVAQQAIPRLRAQGSGTLIFSGASGSLRAGPEFSAFSSAKFALRGLVQALEREHSADGIHIVHTIIDGLIWSEKTQQRFSGAQEPKAMAPQDLAEVYWQLFQQARSTWTHELDIRAPRHHL
ncbi:SDR family NAD(P)-dependent oxidoreductase [Neisseriaceae bacterium TC5R-5]|nr:SDR family NAD(P)-dependent oxidoreductase [Neisseriaceae bacterium TC5R-5]